MLGRLDRLLQLPTMMYMRYPTTAPVSCLPSVSVLGCSHDHRDHEVGQYVPKWCAVTPTTACTSSAIVLPQALELPSRCPSYTPVCTTVLRSALQGQPASSVAIRDCLHTFYRTVPTVHYWPLLKYATANRLDYLCLSAPIRTMWCLTLPLITTGCEAWGWGRVVTDEYHKI